MRRIGSSLLRFTVHAVFSAGTSAAITVLKKCLAMGADKAVLIKDETPETHDGLRTAKIISRALQKRF